MSASTVQQPPLPIYDFTLLQTLAWQATDVVVSAAAKQGTTWLLNIVHQLRTGGDAHFGNLLDERDPTAKIEQIAQFLGITVAADKLPGILEKCSFAWMKEHGAKFEPPLVPGQPRVLHPGGMIRNGHMGESELWDEAGLVAQWEAVHKSELPDAAQRAWCDQGGALP